MKVKHINIQKSNVFADPMYIFSENDSSYPLKTPENQRFSCDFKGYKMDY